MILNSVFHTISFNPSLDRTFYLKKLVFEDINRICESRIDPGGKAVNVAHMIKNLGGNAGVFCFLGGQTGELLQHLLKEHGIRFHCVDIQGETRNIFNFVEKKSGRILRINEQGPEILRAEEKTLYSLLARAHISSADFVVISGSVPPGMPADTYRKITNKSMKYTKYVVIDADGEDLKWGIKAKPFLIKPNLWEIERATGEKIRSLRKAKTICSKLIIENGINIILLTLGEKGALLFSKESFFYAAAPDVELESNVGCGDAFLGGFLYRFSGRKDLKECLRFAVACGAAKAGRKGTIMPGENEILPLLKKIKITIPNSSIFTRSGAISSIGGL